VSYVDKNDTSGVYVNDGVPLTLGDVCKLLEDDTEMFPRDYDPDFRKICGHEYLVWLRQARTYGEVARLLTSRLKARENGVLHPGGLWVSAQLHGKEVTQFNQH
jgi:hypothetical protein